jgi:hypothetical protein
MITHANAAEIDLGGNPGASTNLLRKGLVGLIPSTTACIHSKRRLPRVIAIAPVSLISRQISV